MKICARILLPLCLISFTSCATQQFVPNEKIEGGVFFGRTQKGNLISQQELERGLSKQPHTKVNASKSKTWRYLTLATGIPAVGLFVYYGLNANKEPAVSKTYFHIGLGFLAAELTSSILSGVYLSKAIDQHNEHLLKSQHTSHSPTLKPYVMIGPDQWSQKFQGVGGFSLAF